MNDLTEKIIGGAINVWPIHEAQLLSYLKLSSRRVGLLINFNVKLLKSGIRRLVNDFLSKPRRALRALR